MNTQPLENPFAAPNGALPRYYQARAGLAHLDAFTQTLLAGRSPESIALIGCRGSGKSVELSRVHDALVEGGVMVVSALLSRAANTNLNTFLLGAIDDLLQDRPTRGRLVRTTVRAGIPWASVEGEYVPQASSAPSFCDRVTEVLDPARRPQVRGVALLLDEGDFLTSKGFQSGLETLIHRASHSHEFPFGVIAAGSGWEFDRAMRGRGSFVRDVIRTVPVERLSPDESLELLIRTAGIGGQVWTAAELGPLVDTCQGVPRLLQDSGRRLFDQWSPGAPEETVGSVAADTKAARDHALSLMPTSAYRALDILRPSMGDQTWSARAFRQEIARLSRTENFDKLDRAVDLLFSHGYLEYRADLTIGLAQC